MQKMASARSITLFLVLLHLGIVCVVAGFQSNSSEYQIAMNNLCPKGNYMFNRTSTSFECKTCTSGTFADKPNADSKCGRCRKCDGRHNHVKRKCTATHDTKCKCSPGRFWNKEVSFCVVCDKCGRGEGVTRQCDGRNNTKCEPCKEGHTFSNNSSLTGKCRSCSKCGEGHVVATPCTKRNDTVCRPETGNESELRSSQSTRSHTDKLRTTTDWTTEPTATEGNPNSVAAENGGVTNAALDINLFIAGVAGFVLVIVVVVAVLVIRKKFGRSADRCRSKAASPTTPPSDSSSSISVSSNEDTEAKRSSRILLPPYGPEKYLRDVSFSLISELSRHLNPGGRWKILAGRLGFTATDISNINIKPEESTETMLNRWGQRHDSTINHLFEVLVSLGWKHEAGLIKKYIYLP